MNEKTKQLLDQFPFISFLTYGGNEYLGIIQNCDQFITNFYDFGKLLTPEDKQIYLELGEVWWWESNRMIPINIFMKQDWTQFRYSLRTFNSKDVVIMHGPQINLRTMAQKRIKRKQIVLVKKIPR
jgi:hypothetical protein